MASSVWDGREVRKGTPEQPKEGHSEVHKGSSWCFLSLWPRTDELGYLRSEK